METQKGDKGRMSHQEAGRLGGEARKEELVSEAYAKLGRKGGEAVSQDREHMAEIGRHGGHAHGSGGAEGQGAQGRSGKER